MNAIDYESRLRSALQTLQRMKARLDVLEKHEVRRTEPIAIIGVGCRFPGGVNDLASYWDLLANGVDAIREIPADRWDAAAYYNADPDAPGQMNTRWGGFLDQIDQFDPEFFGIAPREARKMDPQQRLLLEVAIEALEHAGQPQDRLVNSRTGVFIGVTLSDYLQLQADIDPSEIDAYRLTGNVLNATAGRISYLLGLQGPTIALDTACSSSLVSVHLAVQSLRSGECEMALAGGVNAVLSPEWTITLSKNRMLSPTGRCHTFDASADGLVRGEGCGLIVLKRLSDAQAAGDNILGLIRGSAINHDGPKSGFTVPNKLAQQAVIKDALANAGASPLDIGYVEAHGTGTSLGDPIEVRALAAALGEGRTEEQALVLGSVKTNIGHLESAAGIAGLIKALLCLQHRQIPPHLHLQQPSPFIGWDEMPMIVPTAMRAWQAGSHGQLAGTSSFGASGTNAHVILAAAPETTHEAVPAAEPTDAAWLLPISAHNSAALQARAELFRDLLADEAQQISLRDLCYTASRRRAHLDQRLAVWGSTRQELAEHLGRFARGEDSDGVASGRLDPGQTPRVVFVCAGQGPQWWAMGRDLAAREPVFRAALERCDALLRPLSGWSLLDELGRSEADSRINETEVAQPALVSLQIALSELWRSWGIIPDAVVGHSVGEVAAAQIAGVLSLEDAIHIVYQRGRLMQRATGHGKMASVELSETDALAAIAPWGERISVAVANSPSNSVLSGEPSAVQAVLAVLEQRGVRCRLLQVEYASHSTQMAPYQTELVELLRDVKPRAARMPLISTVTGAQVSGLELDAGYWGRNLRQSVRFASAMTHLISEGYDTFLEVAPHPVLTPSIEACLADAERPGAVLLSLQRGRPERETMLTALGQLYARGLRPDWEPLTAGGHAIDLPAYPWKRRRFWLEPSDRSTRQTAVRAGADAEHPLLGRRVRSPMVEGTLFEAELRAERPGFIGDHEVVEVVVLPGTAYLEIALAGAEAAFGTGSHTLEAVALEEAMVLPEGGVRTVQFHLDEPQAGSAGWQLYGSVDGDRWTRHASGTVRLNGAGLGVSDQFRPEEVQNRCPDEMAADLLYANLRERGLGLGARFRGVERIWRGQDEVLGRIVRPEALAEDVLPYRFHPALLDACLQVAAAAWPGDGAMFLPVGLESLSVFQAPGEQLWCHATLRPQAAGNNETHTADLRVSTLSGALVAMLRGVSFKRVEHGVLVRLLTGTGARFNDWLYEVAWRPVGNLASAAPTASDDLPAPRVLVNAAARSWPEIRRRCDLAHYEQLVPALDALSTTHAVLALRELGCPLQRGQRFSTHTLAEQLGIQPRHLRELARLLQFLEEDGVLRRVGDSWEVIAEPTVIDLGPAWAALRAKYPAARGEIDLTERCGQHLAEALTGRADPLQLLFPGGSLDTAEHLYQDSPVLKAYNTVLQEVVHGVVAAHASSRRLRVLEIGAGTGGTASHLLPLLPADQTEYVFTDVSVLFLARAEEKFSTYPFVRYQLLDIGRDPTAQGLAAEQFDIVVASNVLHATADLQETLSHARTLLAAGGLLLLLENTSRQRWADLTFGLTEGWWAFQDKELRPDYPLISGEAWLVLLGRVGFEGAVAAPGLSQSGGTVLQQVFIAQAPHTPASTALAPNSAPGGWLILADSNGVGERLAAAVTSRGEPSVLVRPGPSFAEIAPGRWEIDPSNSADFERLVRSGSQWRGVVFLWGEGAAPADRTTVASLEQDGRLGTGGALQLVQALVKHADGETPRLFLVTRGAQPIGVPDVLNIAQSPLWGFGRAVDLEHPELRCVRIDLDPAPEADVVPALLAEVRSPDTENQIGHRGGQRFAPRLVRRESLPPAPTAVAEQAIRLTIPEPGALDRMVLEPETRRPPGPGEVEVRVRAIGLNFRDVLVALGMLEGPVAEEPIGYDCAGDIVSVGAGVTAFRIGDAVFGTARGCMGTYVTAPAAPLIAKPDSLTFEDAAAIPSAYLTAYYGLHTLAGLKAGERVLIHAAAGGVGLAAVQIAKWAGAEIFATAGSPEKRAYLASLGVQHIMNSRSLEFANEVKALTGGRGVDVVLNSLAGDFITKSMEALAEDGRFIELGRTGVWTHDQAAAVKPRATYHDPELIDEVAGNPGLIATLLQELVALFDAGALQLLPRRDFVLTDAESAFRYMAQARHIGKIVLTPPAPVSHSEDGQPTVRPDGTYLVTGGLRGLGPLIARRLAEQGARTLALAGRREPDEDTRALIAALEGQGVRVEVIQADVSQAADVARLLATIDQTMPPLRGIVHSAGVLDDGVVLQQNWDRFRTVMAPKVDGSWLLHTLTTGRELDFFVLFSTSVAVLGAAGQSNHAAANAFLDALAHHRRALGLPASSINWGPWTEVGAASGRSISEHLAAQGYGGIPVEVGLDLFSGLLSDSPTQVAVLPIQWSRYLGRSEGRRNDPFFSSMVVEHAVALAAPGAAALESAAPASQPRILRDLADATPTRQRSLLIEYVQERAAGVLGADASQLDARRPLNELGLDSLTAVELRNLLSRGLDLKRPLPATLVFDYPTVEAIADYLARDALALAPVAVPAGAAEVTPAPAAQRGGEVTSLLDNLDDLSDEDVEQLLAERLGGG